MSEQKHTPGPWRTGGTNNGRSDWVFADGQAVADCEFLNDDRINLANARLIAAAPDMLEALTQCVLQLQYLADKFGETGTGAAVLARVIAVIEKAEGSTAVHMGRDA